MILILLISTGCGTLGYQRPIEIQEGHGALTFIPASSDSLRADQIPKGEKRGWRHGGRHDSDGLVGLFIVLPVALGIAGTMYLLSEEDPHDPKPESAKTFAGVFVGAGVFGLLFGIITLAEDN